MKMGAAPSSSSALQQLQSPIVFFFLKTSAQPSLMSWQTSATKKKHLRKTQKLKRKLKATKKKPAKVSTYRLE